MPIHFTTGRIGYTLYPVPGSAISLGFWVTLKAWNGTTQQRLMGSGDAVEMKVFVSTTKFQGDIYQTTGQPSVYNMALDTRVCIYCTAAYPGNTLKTYVNGALDNDLVSGTIGITTPQNFEIGGRYGSSDYANAIIEDARVYNRVLAASEIQEIYAARGNDRIRNGLLSRWLIYEPNSTADISTDTIYDRYDGKNMTKVSGAATYYPSLLTTRRRV